MVPCYERESSYDAQPPEELLIHGRVYAAMKAAMNAQMERNAWSSTLTYSSLLTEPTEQRSYADQPRSSYSLGQ